MSKDKLTKILNETKTSLSEVRIKAIRKHFNKPRDRFLNPKIKKKNKKNLLPNKKQKKIFLMIAMCNIDYFYKV